jgi:hypothetical protein
MISVAYKVIANEDDDDDDAKGVYKSRPSSLDAYALLWSYFEVK